jgi:hypothetical protein
MKRILSKDPLSGVTQWYVSDPLAGTFKFVTEQDCTPIVEDSKAQYNNTDERARWGEWAKVATIPLTILHSLKKQGIADDPVRMKRWLNSPENRYFRTRPGRV